MAEFFASGPRATENLIAAELKSYGAEDLHERGSGVLFHGSIEVGYRACLWSRVASRVFLVIAHGEADTFDELYEQCRQIAWNEHFSNQSTISVSFTKAKSRITNTKHASLVVKDAIVDSFREVTGQRPNVDTEHPDIRIRAHADTGSLEVSIDLSGDSLHRRAYRTAAGEAPLKENVAAAMLARARWLQTADTGGAFVDPMCGSGTLLIEAAMAAGDEAPGLSREQFGFHHWSGHDESVWQTLRDEAVERKQEGRGRIPEILGFDISNQAIRTASQNIANAGFSDIIRVKPSALHNVAKQCAGVQPGLIATNPPYGKRLGSESDLEKTYRELGQIMLSGFGGWRASVLTSDQVLSKAIGLRAWHVNTLYNGSIKCILAHFEIHADRTKGRPDDKPTGAAMIVNRLKKNHDRKAQWAKSHGISCYRLYDADMPEYSAAIDVYEHQWIHIQEYAAPPTVDPARAAKRFRELTEAVRTVLDVSDDQLFIKKRMKQRGTSQYGRQADTGDLYEAHEDGLSFLVNFTDYLDTGLFLDHRITRSMVRKHAQGRDVLNLFCYTGSFSVFAAAGGARSVTSIDMSHTYLSLAEENMALNGYAGASYTFRREDCIEWAKQVSKTRTYGLVIVDPPTFSNSKNMNDSFEIQRDHQALIRNIMNQVDKDGMLLFSTPKRKFKLDESLSEDFDVEDITAVTTPEDFDRKLPHHAFIVKK